MVISLTKGALGSFCSILLGLFSGRREQRVCSVRANTCDDIMFSPPRFVGLVWAKGHAGRGLQFRWMNCEYRLVWRLQNIDKITIRHNPQPSAGYGAASLLVIYGVA